MAPASRGIEFRLFGRRFRPTLWPSVFAAAGLVVLVGLGTWQVQRHFWKEALIAERTARLEGPAIALPPAGAAPESYAYHRVTVRGRFLNDREMYLAARSLNGRLGFHVVTPLRLEDGGTVLVDRGWVPLDNKDPETRPDSLIDGTTTLTGVLRAGGRRSRWLVPDNEPEGNVWFYVDPAAMADHAGLGELPGYYIEAAAGQSPGRYPVGGQTRIHLPRNHLGYAATWYGLAVALAVIWLVYHRAPEPGETDGTGPSRG